MNMFKRKEKITMVTPEEYFFNYLSWRIDGVSNSNLSPQAVRYESFSAMADIMLEQEANCNIPGAIHEQGERYLYGLGIPQNIEKAIICFNKSAMLGHPESNGRLAEIYKSDEYGMVDMKKYFELLEKSAERGSWISMFNLACAYYKGKNEYKGYGFAQNKKLSFEWMMKTYITTRDLLKLIFSHPCSNSFREYAKSMCQMFNRTVTLLANQLIEGDGISKDKQQAKCILEEAISTVKELFNTSDASFEELLQRCL